jgi:hypothetical protein
MSLIFDIGARGVEAVLFDGGDRRIATAGAGRSRAAHARTPLARASDASQPSNPTRRAAQPPS